jgi:hypothetical protein
MGGKSLRLARPVRLSLAVRSPSHRLARKRVAPHVAFFLVYSAIALLLAVIFNVVYWPLMWLWG